MPTNEQVMDALNQVMDPELHRSLVDLKMVRDLDIAADGTVSFTLVLTIPSCPLRNQMAADAERALKVLPGIREVKIAFGSMTVEERKALMGDKMPLMPKLAELNKVGRMIAVMSGKGGVGKSSVTALMASALIRQGKKVGVLDADITGPSIPKLFGLPPGGLRGSDQGLLPAVTCSGIRVISTNLLVQSDDTAVIWRGPLISSAIQQFWMQTLWGKLDTLLVDLPPGTSDAALTVVQSLPLTGVVLVTTPQELAVLVVRKAMSMLAQVNIPILGVVENMGYFKCPDCGSSHEIFGPSHLDGIRQAAGMDLPVARLPIQPGMAEMCDAGKVEDIRLPEIEIFLQELEGSKK
jgi:Mrp family chromosome partitioning ATPase